MVGVDPFRSTPWDPPFPDIDYSTYDELYRCQATKVGHNSVSHLQWRWPTEGEWADFIGQYGLEKTLDGATKLDLIHQITEVVHSLAVPDKHRRGCPALHPRLVQAV